MQEPDELNSADRQLEETLKSFTPSKARVDVVGAAYEAGRRSVRRQLRLWRAATAALLLIGAGVVLFPIEGPRSNVPIAIARPSPVVSQRLAAQSVISLEAAIREHGVEGLPANGFADVGRLQLPDLL